MPATIQDTLNAAAAEWNHWGSSTWNLITGVKKIKHTDDEDKFAQYVIDHYCSVGGGSPSKSQISNDDYAWSAVGLSAIMKNAGFNKNEFPFAEGHSVWIRKFIKARIDKDKAAPFWGFRLGEKGGEPGVGDLVAYARSGSGQKKMTAAKAATFFDKTSSYYSHSDLVVASRPGEIDVIGANVLDSVTKKTLRLDATGHISDGDHFWFATLKRR